MDDALLVEVARSLEQLLYNSCCRFFRVTPESAEQPVHGIPEIAPLEELTYIVVAVFILKELHVSAYVGVVQLGQQSHLLEVVAKVCNLCLGHLLYRALNASLPVDAEPRLGVIGVPDDSADVVVVMDGDARLVHNHVAS